MTEKGYKGGLVSRIRNQFSGKKYMISTAQEIGKSYWASAILRLQFLGLWPDLFHPLYTIIRNNKEAAHDVHASLKKMVATIPEENWLESIPDPEPEEGFSDDAKAILKKHGL